MKKILLILPLLSLGCEPPKPVPLVHPIAGKEVSAPGSDTHKEIEELRRAKAWKDLQRFCSKVLASNPNNPIAWVALGEAEDKLGHTDLSIEACNNAVKLDPEFSDAWFNLGIAYNHANQHEKVLDCFKKLTELHDAKASEFWESYGKSSQWAIERIKQSRGVALKVKYRPATLGYPPSAKAARIQGVVSLALYVGIDGRVFHIEILEGPEELRNSALEYGKQWLFEPLMVDGVAVKSRFLLNVPFRLK